MKKCHSMMVIRANSHVVFIFDFPGTKLAHTSRRRMIIWESCQLVLRKSFSFSRKRYPQGAKSGGLAQSAATAGPAKSKRPAAARPTAWCSRDDREAEGAAGGTDTRGWPPNKDETSADTLATLKGSRKAEEDQTSTYPKPAELRTPEAKI